jgi:adenosylhomocysteine nucleosidase
MVLRSVVYSFLRHAAGDLLDQSLKNLSKAAENEASGECQVGFVFAMGVEAGGLEDLLSDLRVYRGEGFRSVTGRFEGRRVALVVTGMGREAARQGTRALIDGHRPRYVISAGYSGGLRPDVKLGDIVLADRVVDCTGAQLAVDLRADPTSARQPGLHVGALVTADRLICLPAEKASLGQEHSALAVDMESFAVAQICQQARVPFLAARIISDDSQERLPKFLARYSLQNSLAGKTGVVVGALLKRPADFKMMYKMREESVVLSDRLARFLTSLMRELVPAPEQSTMQAISLREQSREA